MSARFVALAGAAVYLSLPSSSAHAAREPERITDAPFYLTVDLSSRTLSAYKDGEKVGSYSVAVGQPDYPTPTGSYRIGHIVWNPSWVPPDSRWARNKRPTGPGDPDNPMGRVKMYFRDPDLYIHGTHDVDSLGEAESHGCIRMRNGEAIELARMVMRNGGSAQQPGWFRRVLNSITRTRAVYLSNPVPVEIHS
jgi:lipoprotein-anchoring transpeptidase ErfK/SrfK